MVTQSGRELEEGDDFASLSHIWIVPRPLQRVPTDLNVAMCSPKEYICAILDVL